MRKIVCILYIFLCGCGHGIIARSGSEVFSGSRGYVLYVYTKKTEVMIDFCRKDGLSAGTRLDVFRPNVPGMDEPVKIGEIKVDKVGKKMSKAKVTEITSSLKMERGDRILPHPIIIGTDATWITQRAPEKGWRSEYSLPNERNWEHCEVLLNMQDRPKINQLIEDTNAKPIWHPSTRSRFGDVFFRQAFIIDAKAISAKMDVVCGGKANIYLNDKWISEIKDATRADDEEWPVIESFNVRPFLRWGRNIVAVQIYRDQRSITPPILLMAITVKTGF